MASILAYDNKSRSSQGGGLGAAGAIILAHEIAEGLACRNNNLRNAINGPANPSGNAHQAGIRVSNLVAIQLGHSYVTVPTNAPNTWHGSFRNYSTNGFPYPGPHKF